MCLSVCVLKRSKSQIVHKVCKKSNKRYPGKDYDVTHLQLIRFNFILFRFCLIRRHGGVCKTLQGSGVEPSSDVLLARRTSQRERSHGRQVGRPCRRTVSRRLGSLSGITAAPPDTRLADHPAPRLPVRLSRT